MTRQEKIFPNNRVDNCAYNRSSNPDYIWEMVVHRKCNTEIGYHTFIPAGIYTYVFDVFDDLAEFERGIYAFSHFNELEIKSIIRINRHK